MRSLVVEEIAAALRYHDLPGPGVPLVFVHGLGCSSSSDFPMVAADPALADRRRILIDLLGSGFSDRPADFSYSIEASADLVGRLIAAATDGPVDLFGHSMGGTIAIVVADRLGERVRRLVLGEPNLDSGGGSYSRRVAAATEAEWVAHGHAALIAASRAEGNPLWAATLAASAPHAVHRAAVSLVAGATPSWRQRLLRRAGSATVIFGEASLPDPDTEALPRAGVAVSVLAGAGHSMAWDDPHGLAQAIRDGLAE